MQSFGDFFANNKLLAIAALAVACVVAVAVCVAAYRLLFGGRLRMSGGRTRQPRLGVVDAFDLDRQRQLVIVRRDNVEHLLMIGGPNDLVIEAAIVRAAGAPALVPREKDGNAAQAGVVVPAVSHGSGFEQNGGPVPVITPPMAAPGPLVKSPEVSTIAGPGPSATPPPPAAAPPSAPPPSERAGPPFQTPRPMSNSAAPLPRPVPPLPQRQPIGTGPRPVPVPSALPPRQPAPPPRPLATPTRLATPVPPAANAGATTRPAAEAKTAEAGELPAQGGANGGEPPPPRQTSAAPAPREAPPVNPQAASESAAQVAKPEPPRPPAPPLRPVESAGNGSKPGSPTPAPPRAAPVPPPKPPVRSLDALESLEEEMAKLLGRPVPPADR